jgi:hypothetical protein
MFVETQPIVPGVCSIEMSRSIMREAPKTTRYAHPFYPCLTALFRAAKSNPMKSPSPDTRPSPRRAHSLNMGNE